MQDATDGLFHDEVRHMNDNDIIRKYYSRESFILDWLTHGMSVLHAYPTKDTVPTRFPVAAPSKMNELKTMKHHGHFESRSSPSMLE